MSRFVKILGSKNYIGSGCEKIAIITSDNCTVQPYVSSIAFTNCSGCTSQVGASGIVMINSSGCISHAGARNITLINCSGVTTTEFDNNQVIIKNKRYYQSGSVQITASAPYTVSTDYDMHYINPSGGNVTIYFDDPAKFRDHPGLCFKRVAASANSIKFYSFGSELIEFGVSPQSLIPNLGDTIIFTSDGTDWYLKSKT